MRVEATTAELKAVGDKMDTLRTELMRHAHAGAQAAGFQKTDECALASFMVLVGAAQRYALQSRQHYQIFKTICADMAASEADAVVTRAWSEMGPEATHGAQVTEGGIVLPTGDDISKLVN